MNYEFFLQIALAKGVGDAALRRVIRFLSDNQDISWDILCADVSLQSSVFNNKEEILQGIAAQKENAIRIAENLYKNNIRLV